MQSQTEFKERIQTARQEIQTRFIEFTDQLKQEETRLLEKLNEIENEVIKDIELSSKTLIEITQAREQTLATLKSNTTNTLLKNTLEMYDKEIEAIKNQSIIDSTTIQLQWNANRFNIGNICELTLMTDQKVQEIPIPSLPTKYLKPLSASVIPHFEAPEIYNNLQLQFDDLHFDGNNFYMNEFVSSSIDNNNNNKSDSPLAGRVIQPYYSNQSTTSHDDLGEQPSVEQRNVESQFWQCQYCTVLNPMQYSMCEICERTPNF